MKDAREEKTKHNGIGNNLKKKISSVTPRFAAVCNFFFSENIRRHLPRYHPRASLRFVIFFSGNIRGHLPRDLTDDRADRGGIIPALRCGL